MVGGEPWFLIPSANEVGVFDPVNFQFQTYSLSSANITGFAPAIVADSSGNLWFTEPGGIGAFSTTSHTVIAQVTLPSSTGTEMPSAIAVGPDGNIWFTESVPNASGTGFASSAVGVIDVTTGNSITEFPTPATSQPSGITAGPDGNVWFTETGAGAIGLVNVAGLSDPSRYTLGAAIPIPTTGETGGVLSHPAPVGITSGPNNTVWFADKSGAVGVVTVADHLGGNHCAAFERDGRYGVWFHRHGRECLRQR